MDPITQAYITTAVFACLVAAAGAWWYRRNRPLHTFIGLDFGANSAQPKRIGRLYGPFKVKRNDKTVVNFPVPQGFAVSRQDGRGTMFFGDLATGQLLRPTRDVSGFEAVSGIFIEKAFADGRVQQIVASTKGTGLTLQHILIGLAVVAGLVCIVIYQFAKAGGL